VDVRRCALFLDRDGVVNIDHGYVCTREKFEFVDGIFELCRYASQLGFLNVVVTNQAGIARGYYSEEDFLALSEWMCGVFLERGAPIAKVYYCPFHSKHGVGTYKRESTDRKPAPGMVLRAQAEFDLDLARSLLVGDQETDIQAGVAAAIGCNLLYRPGEEYGVVRVVTGATSRVSRLTDVMPFLDAQKAAAEIAGHTVCM
jgi:D-glycero-D-manno-heptose 1,7-bisphosphate phosphatase